VTESEFLRTAALVTAAALRGDDMAVRLLLATLTPEQVAAVCEGSVLAMAGLLREALTPEALARAVTDAQQLAQAAATERN
jgi:ABC-type enterochelin transport system permease subunit